MSKAMRGPGRRRRPLASRVMEDPLTRQSRLRARAGVARRDACKAVRLVTASDGIGWNRWRRPPVAETRVKSRMIVV